jgi:hypothetical protein
MPDVLLGPVDGFLAVTHLELVDAGLPGNACVVMAALDGRVDVPALSRRVREACAAMPELGWRFERGLAGFRWRTGLPPRQPLAVRAFDGEPLDAAMQLLERRIDPRAPWQLELLRGREHDALALRWFHPLADARAATRLLGWLASAAEPPPAAARWDAGTSLLAAVDEATRRELLRAYAAHAIALGRRPILSFERAARRRPPGRQRAVRWLLSPSETQAFYKSTRKRAQLADTSLLFWAAARLCDDLMRARGMAPAQQLVPVPLSLDPKGEVQRLFGNHLAMMMLSLDRDDLRDEARAVASLARQRRDIVQQKLDLAMLVAFAMVSKVGPWLPRRLGDWFARRPFGGERSSYVLSNPGELGLSSVAGRQVIDCFALATVLPSPGLQVIASRHGGRLGVTFQVREGYVGLDEIVSRREAFFADLLAGA